MYANRFKRAQDAKKIMQEYITLRHQEIQAEIDNLYAMTAGYGNKALITVLTVSNEQHRKKIKSLERKTQKVWDKRRELYGDSLGIHNLHPLFLMRKDKSK